MKCCRLAGSKASKLFLVLLFIGLMLFGFQRIRSIESARHQSASTRENEWTRMAASRENHKETTSLIQLDNEENPTATPSQPLLPDDRPDWVALPDSVEGETHRIAIGTELANTIDECRSKLDIALVDGMQRYVNEHLSKNQKQLPKLPELNAQWIRKHLLDPEREYEATLERPAGTFHQLWVQLKMDGESRATIERSIQRLETKSRAGVVGLAAVGCVVCLAVMNVGLRFLAKKH